MNTILFSLLAIVSLMVFMNLGKIRASKKQTDRDDRINWSRSRKPNFYQNRDGSKIIEGEAEEVDDQNNK
jgi:hypothetical protein